MPFSALIKRGRFPVAALCLWLGTGGIGRATSADEPDRPDLFVNPASMEQWNDWRFGMFIHWGPWSQTGVGYIWKMVFEDTPAERRDRFTLYRTFNPTNFAPERWARAAKEAGMKYVVFVVKHHDGFNNYDTSLSDFKVTSPASPWSAQPQPDITRAVIDAFRAEGLAIGLYYSHIDWHHPDGRSFSVRHPDYDIQRVDGDPASWERFAAYQKGQLRELLTNYGKIDLIWFDIGWPFAMGGLERIPNPRVREDVLEMLTMMKELQPDIIFNDRGTDLYGGFHTPEQLVPETGLPGYWESSITITNERGFWYKGDHVSAKSGPQLVRLLIEIASKGGNFLMNVGPRPDGELSQGEYVGLAEVGEWMKVNHESIYDTDKSRFLELPWGRSTSRGHTLYLHVYDWPTEGRLLLPGLQSAVKRAYFLADPTRQTLVVQRDGEDSVVEVPAFGPDQVASVIVLEFADDPVIVNAIRPGENGVVLLTSARAEIQSATAAYNHGRGIRPGRFIEGLKSPADRVSWNFKVEASGAYRVLVDYAARSEDCGGSYQVSVDDGSKVAAEVESTAQWEGNLLDMRKPSNHGQDTEDKDPLFGEFEVGTVPLTAGSSHRLSFAPTRVLGEQLMYLRHVRLVPER